MQRSQLKEISSWMAEVLNKESMKMFGSKSATATSTFYTDLDDADGDDLLQELAGSRHSHASEDGNSQDSGEEQNFTNHAFQRIASLAGFPRFQSFVNDDSTAIVQMTHSVFDYRSSRYVATKRTSHHHHDSYAVSESESEEESESPQLPSKFPSTPEELNSPDEATEDTLVRKKRAQNVAEELLASEKTYVNILHLIDQVFQFRVDQENRAHPMFAPETVQHMFSNVKSIYKFHNDFLLPQLQTRMGVWANDPRIGDIMKNFAPFLKMYTEYVKNFDYAINLISTLQAKVPRFASIINEIQKLDECGKLTLSHHMLSPIQRLPRYELLLKDYLGNLPDEHPDLEDTKRALELVSRAANHSNEEMKKIDKFKKLLEIQESICEPIDLVSATRELIKEGRIVKISARSADHQERYLFLFSDILLLCSARLIPGQYRLRAKFAMENLEVIEGDNLETANTFYLRDGNKSVELYTECAAEMTAWLDALFQTMQEIMRRKASLKTGNVKTTLVKVDDVTRCMVCEAIFSVMKRKHNCRACGIVVCSKCSNQKLLFEDNKNMRVCRLCHAALTQPLSNSPSSPAGPMPSLLQVSASVPCVLSGYLFLKTQASKPWTRRWFALHPDFVLYTFKSDSERSALTATPMPGFTITDGAELPDEDPLNARDRKGAFKIYHSRKCYYLQASSQVQKDRWTHALNLAAKAELPQSKADDSPQSQSIDN